MKNKNNIKTSMIRVFKFILSSLWLISSLFCLVINQVQAQEVPAQIKFVTIHTPHFDVIVNAEQQLLGQYYANQLEKIDAYMSTFISERPSKTIVIINDKLDITNGYATRVPYPHIMIFPVLPGTQDSLAETGDWSLELLSHEYTHILNFEPSPGYVKYLRPIFGSIMAPNILLPTWWKEGVAVHVESSISNGGRLRSAYQDAAIRAFVLSDKLRSYDLAQINEVLPTWPEGMRAYLFGSVMWSQMAEDQGPQIVDKLFQAQGRRVPYFIETPARENFGQSYLGEYAKALDQTEERARKQIEILKQAPVTDDSALAISKADFLMAPSISPNGEMMALVAKDDRDNRSVRIFTKNPTTQDFIGAKELIETESETDSAASGKIFDGPPTGSIGRVSWFHQSKQIVYDKIDSVNSIEKYSDLYAFDISTRKTTQLTYSLRAREPFVSLDDQKIAFVKLEANQTALALYDLNTKRAQILVPPVFGQKISFPVFRTNDEIVYSLSEDRGSENLWVYNLSTKKSQKVTNNIKRARFPWSTPQGTLFTSSQNGVHNIYLISKDGEPAKPLTNTLTAYLSLTQDPTNGDLYATKMTDNGPWVYKIAAHNFLASPTPLPHVDSLFADRYPDRDAGPITNVTYPTEDYSIDSTLWPKYWIPFIATSTNGVLFQATTSGFDPLKKHQYSLNAGWDTYLQKASFVGIYQNNIYEIPWFLQSSITNTYFANASDYQTSKNYLVGIAPSVFEISRYLSLALSFKQTTIEYPTLTRRGFGPSVNVTYSDITESGVQISPENGKSLTFGTTQYLKNGDDLNHELYVLSSSFYTNKWLPSRHAIMAKVNGLYIPEKVTSSLGTSSQSLALNQDTIGPNFLMRGYLTGHFIGRNMLNANFEYRFPIRDIYRGNGTDPFYVRRLHGAFIVDGIATDGFAYKANQQTYLATDINKKFWSAGAELRLETTVGYALPVQFVVYYYMPQNTDYGGNSSMGLTIQMAQSF